MSDARSFACVNWLLHLSENDTSSAFGKVRFTKAAPKPLMSSFLQFCNFIFVNRPTEFSAPSATLIVCLPFSKVFEKLSGSSNNKFSLDETSTNAPLLVSAYASNVPLSPSALKDCSKVVETLNVSSSETSVGKTKMQYKCMETCSGRQSIFTITELMLMRPIEVSKSHLKSRRQ